MSEEKVPAQPEKVEELAKGNDPKHVEIKAEKKSEYDKNQDAINKIEAAYSKAKMKIRTPLANFQESVLNQIMRLPLEKLSEEITQAITDAHGAPIRQDVAEEFAARREKTVSMAEAYIEKMAQGVGLDAEAVSRMVSDQNRKASRFVDLMISGKHPELEDAMLFALGRTDAKSSSMAEAQEKAQKTIIQYLNSDLDKPDSDLIQYIWSIFSFMDEKPRMEIAQAYMKGKPTEKVEAFLQKGNTMGIFTWEEMRDLNPLKKYTEQEIKTQQLNYQAQTDFRKQALALSTVSYGTENDAGKGINLRNIIFLFAKAGSVATVFGNFVTGAWQGGKFQGIGKALKRITNPQSLTAIAIYGGIKVLESESTIDMLLYGNKEEEKAAADLRKQKNNNTKWVAWDSFFQSGKDSNEFSGGKIFFNYIQNLKKIYDETDINKLSSYLTPQNFQEYLQLMASRKKDPKDGKTTENMDYSALSDSFKKVNPEEIMTFARIFDTLNIGGKNGKNEYERFLREPTNTPDKDKKIV